jgi:hypothetical protein
MNVSDHVVDREYRYHPTWTKLALGCGFFAACTALFTYLAITKDQVVEIQGLLRLSPFGGRFFYWILAAAGAAFMAAGIFLTFIRLTSVQRIAVTRTGLILPTGKWNCRDEALVEFKDIVAVKQLQFHGNQYLYIYALGLCYTVDKGFLAASDFDQIAWVLEARVPTRKTA